MTGKDDQSDRIGMGDYTNAKFGGRVFTVDRFEHRPGVLSVVTHREEGKDYEHKHFNIPTKLLRRMLKAQLKAEKDAKEGTGRFYPNDRDWPEVKP